MRTLLPALAALTVCVCAHADTTGRIAGKIIAKDGKPIANALVTLKRVDIKWTKELKTNASGTFMQVGLDPKEFEISVAAPGYVTNIAKIKIPLGDTLAHNITLFTPEEARSQSQDIGPVKEDPASAAAASATDAYNQSIAFYNRQDLTSALPLAEKAYLGFKESAEKSADAEGKKDAESKLVNAEKVYSTCLLEVGAKAEEQTKKEMWTKAEPMILKLYEKNPKDQRTVKYLLDISQLKGDSEAIKKYQAELDVLAGPRPELAYNQGVEMYNKGNLKGAKPHFIKAIEINPKFEEAYYLLAMCEYADMNLKGTKANFQKYLELAPTGKHADEVKAMLADPSLKNIK